MENAGFLKKEAHLISFKVCFLAKYSILVKKCY